MKKINIHNPHKLPVIDPEKLEDLQGDLYDYKKVDKLKRSLVKYGVIVPKFVWESKGKLFIADGHKTKNALISLRNIRDINYNSKDVPFAPYLADIAAMDDRIPEQRNRGIRNALAVIERTKIDELRVFGDNVSKGMMAEVKCAIVKGIPVRFMSTIARVRFVESLGLD